MKKLFIIFIFSLLLSSCITSGGGNWWYVDFDKEYYNYRDLSYFTSSISIGMTQDQLMSKFRSYLEIVEATKYYTTLGIDQWEATFGNDYIIRVLYIKIVSGQIDQFIIKEIPNQRTTIPIFIWQ